LTFTGVSDQGESEATLRAQLRLVHEILLFIFGPVALNQKKQTNFIKVWKNEFLFTIIFAFVYLF